MNYEQFKSNLFIRLSDRFSTEELRIIGQNLDLVAVDYDIQTKNTSVAVYDKTQIPEAVKLYLICKKTEGMADGTLYNYGHYLKMFFQDIQKHPREVTANDIRVYLFRYQQERNIQLASLDKFRMYLSSFYKWASREGYVDKDPTANVAPIKCEKKSRNALTQVELEYLRRACSSKRDLAIVEVMYSTGCRVSELAILKKQDIDFSTKRVALFGKGKKHRTSFLNAKAIVALKSYLEERTDSSEYLFVTERIPIRSLKKPTVERIISKISDKAFENTGKRVTPHILRHTTATTAIQNGMPLENLSKLLGHSRLDTTLIYAEINLEDIESEHRKFII